MKTLTVSEEMKAKIRLYFNSETNRYDIEAIREAQYAATPRRRYSGIFDGTDDDGQITEHTMLSAAVELNEELDHADANVQNTDAIVADIVNWNMPADDKYGEKTIYARFNRLTEFNQRQLVHKLLEILASVSGKSDDRSSKINNRVLYAFGNQLRLAHGDGGNDYLQDASINLNAAYDFLKRGTGEIFTELPEEYLASLGL